MLNECDANRLAADMADLLPDEVALSRPTAASDGLGGRSNTFSQVDTIPARVSVLSARQAEEVVGAKVRDATYYRIALPAGTDVRLKDRVLYAGLTLSVEFVPAPRSIEIDRVILATRAAT